MGDVICVDATFTPEQLAFYKVWGVEHPEQDKIYSVREVKRHSNGNVGLLLNEIINPEVPVISPILGEIWIETTWKISRFRTLNNDKIEHYEHERQVSELRTFKEISSHGF